MLEAASCVPKPNASKKVKPVNLSPAKKFRLRLRRAKFRNTRQDEYFEHDNRDLKSIGSQKKKAARLNMKDRRAQMYIDAYLMTQHLKRNSETVSQDESQDFSHVALESIVRRANELLPIETRLAYAYKDQAIRNDRIASVSRPSHPSIPPSPLTCKSSTVKCCCHCACTGRKKNPRRKLSSPYFGDFEHAMSFSSGTKKAACLTTKVLNKTTTMTHHQTLMRAGEIRDYSQISLNAAHIANNQFLSARQKLWFVFIIRALGIEKYLKFVICGMVLTQNFTRGILLIYFFNYFTV